MFYILALCLHYRLGFWAWSESFGCPEHVQHLSGFFTCYKTKQQTKTTDIIALMQQQH